MKKSLGLILCFCLSFWANAIVSKTIDLTTAGSLSEILTAQETSLITNLTITGLIDARDIKHMRDEMKVLETIDMSNAVMVAYDGSGGTSTTTNSYAANKMPDNSFYVFNATQTLKNIALPSSLTIIGKSAFRGCYITKIHLPKLITRIEAYAFSSCVHLNNITLPDRLEAIDSYAFYFCMNLSSITLPNSLISIGSSAFINTNLNLITCLGEVPSTLGSGAFSSSLQFIYVPTNAIDAYKTASGWRDYNVIAQKHVTIDNPIAGELAATIINSGNSPLTDITHLTVQGNINTLDISHMNFNMTSLTSLDLSEVVLENNILPDNSFTDKISLSSIVLPATVVSIGSEAFSGCYNLTCPIPLPASVQSIGRAAFRYCSGLTGELIIPLGVSVIEIETFRNCSNLTGSLIIPNSVTTIGFYAFVGCWGFTGNLTIPNSVTEIHEGAFIDCRGFTGNLTIPNSVTKIYNSAFSGCYNFTGNLSLSQNLTTIYPNVFNGCKNLSGVLTIPETVTTIGESAFSGVRGVSSLLISKNTTTIGDNAFYGCSGLVKITVPRSLPPTIYSGTFNGVNKEFCELVLPTGASDSYRIADYWNLFILVTEENSVGIQKTPTKNNSPINVYTKNKNIVVAGVPQGQVVSLYNINGTLLQNIISQGESLTFLAKSGTIYLVNIGSETFKLTL